MQSLKNITIGRRIFIGLGLLLVILVVQGMFSLGALSNVNNKVVDIEKGDLPSAILLGKINTQVADLSGDQLRYVQASSADELASLESDMQETVQTVEQDQADLKKLPSSPAEKQLYSMYETQWATYLTNYASILSLAKAHKAPELTKALNSQDELFDQITDSLGKLVALNEADTSIAVAKIDSSFSKNRKIVYLGVLLALFVVLVGGWYMRQGASQISEIIRSSVDQLIKLSLALSASTQQASAGAQQNAAIAQQVAAGATQQSKQAEEISEGLTQMSQAIQQMATTSQGVSVNTTQASKLAQQTGESTEKINKMADVVTTTAEQTNLLALNAAIEAARAGEAGRGFAVVADEVRKLADSSSKAAGEVRQVIKEVVSNISVTVESIGNSSLKIGEVASGIGQQSVAIGQIASTMNSIASVAQQSASGAQQLSASTQQTSAATQQVAAASTDLLRLADALQKLVRKTKNRSADEVLNKSQTPSQAVSGGMRLARPSVYHAAEDTAPPVPSPRLKPATHIDIMAPKRSLPSHSVFFEEPTTEQGTAGSATNEAASSNEPN